MELIKTEVLIGHQDFASSTRHVVARLTIYALIETLEKRFWVSYIAKRTFADEPEKEELIVTSDTVAGAINEIGKSIIFSKYIGDFLLFNAIVEKRITIVEPSRQELFSKIIETFSGGLSN